ncbi:MAG: gamma-glutamyl-gamma-aminobutyrate hydrolase family protein [Brucellaceae bacterium]|nr:gamma-glutamyl-gamma-aminobutyrate hydrolase family protein [Brucellaceae bacterium]
MPRKPLVALAADVRHFEGYDWHASPSTYLDAAIEAAGVVPLIVPAFGDRIDIDAVLDAVDGVMVSGSKSNVHPARYGVEPSPDHEPYDEARDATSIPLISRALERGIPVFAICRGIQELNVALGGSLATEIQEGEGRMDHRAPDSTEQSERFAIRHPVTVAPGSCLANALGETETVRVNSLHRQAIDRLGNGLVAEAVADDGTIEAVSVKDAKAFAIGVQWHPEYWHREDNVSRHLFQAFGDAVRAHAQAGQG